MDADTGGRDGALAGLGVLAGTLAARDPERRLDLLLAEVQASGALPPDTDLEMLRRYLHLYRARLAAARAYRLRPYHGRLALFLPQNARKRRGPVWERFAGAEVDVRAVAGDHYSMLRAPAVEGLARELQELLEEATPR